MAKKIDAFRCEACGASFAKWVGRCSNCGEWNRIQSNTGRGNREVLAQRFSDINIDEAAERHSTGIDFVDRVLGGGLPKSSVVLLAGEPGVGKSTLLFQVFASQKGRCLYVSAEESAQQVAYRFRRAQKQSSPDFYLLTESKLSLILEQIDALRPEMVAIDSIQMIHSDLQVDRMRAGHAGIREVAESLLAAAKSKGFDLWIVGHVTKDGEIAGPKVLEHLVDTVLYFGQSDQHDYRLLQTQKHRFGQSGELALLEMTAQGLSEKADAESFWVQNRAQSVSGCAYAPVMMGSRVYCVEIQALCTPTYFPSPRRSTSGFDLNRFLLLLAVIESRLKLPLSRFDVYLNVVGGIKLSDPAADLAVAAAVVSAFSEKIIPSDWVLCAELGLTGELRSVPQIRDRIRSVSRIGKKEILVAPVPDKSADATSEIKRRECARLEEVVDILWGKNSSSMMPRVEKNPIISTPGRQKSSADATQPSAKW